MIKLSSINKVSLVYVIVFFYLFRMHAEYLTTFKTELQRCSQWITFLELRVEKSLTEAEDYPGYQQLREEHIVSR